MTTAARKANRFTDLVVKSTITYRERRVRELALVLAIGADRIRELTILCERLADRISGLTLVLVCYLPLIRLWRRERVLGSRLGGAQ